MGFLYVYQSINITEVILLEKQNNIPVYFEYLLSIHCILNNKIMLISK